MTLLAGALPADDDQAGDVVAAFAALGGGAWRVDGRRVHAGGGRASGQDALATWAGKRCRSLSATRAGGSSAPIRCCKPGRGCTGAWVDLLRSASRTTINRLVMLEPICVYGRNVESAGGRRPRRQAFTLVGLPQTWSRKKWAIVLAASVTLMMALGCCFGGVQVLKSESTKTGYTSSNRPSPSSESPKVGASSVGSSPADSSPAPHVSPQRSKSAVVPHTTTQRREDSVALREIFLLDVPEFQPPWANRVKSLVLVEEYQDGSLVKIATVEAHTDLAIDQEGYDIAQPVCRYVITHYITDSPLTTPIVEIYGANDIPMMGRYPSDATGLFCNKKF